MLRPNGVVEELRLEPSDGALVSTQDIVEPHYFEIEAEVNWPGKAEPLKASLEKDEGLIALAAEQVAAAGIRSAAAAPAALEATSQFPGEIKFNADRTAHRARLAGVAQEAPVELGQMVKKGELLAALSSTALSDLRSEWLAAVKRRDGRRHASASSSCGAIRSPPNRITSRRAPPCRKRRSRCRTPSRSWPPWAPRRARRT